MKPALLHPAAASRSLASASCWQQPESSGVVAAGESLQHRLRRDASHRLHIDQSTVRQLLNRGSTLACAAAAGVHAVRRRRIGRGRRGGRCAKTPLAATEGSRNCVLLLGGSGRIGTAAAAHLLKRTADNSGPSVVLGGRNQERGKAAVDEVIALAGPSIPTANAADRVSFRELRWDDPKSFRSVLEEIRPIAVVHTAGPFDDDSQALVLRTVVEAGVPVYVDVADPIEYIDAAQALSPLAAETGTMAMITAGAFPGMSNVLAVDCAQRLGDDAVVKDVDFAYFTAGLGGSGPVNLLITNVGFGNPLPVFRSGAYAPQMEAGTGLRPVDFFLGDDDPTAAAVGKQDVWLWPFPEAATVARTLKITGKSNAGMGTAPGIWNTILVLLVEVVPRAWWRVPLFSEALAYFSLPLVWLTDAFMGVETHAMRVEVTSEDGRRAVAVQSHQSFRMCVAQSTVEFMLELLESYRSKSSHWRPGVYLPEELAEDSDRRRRLISRLTSTEGTIAYRTQEFDSHE